MITKKVLFLAESEDFSEKVFSNLKSKFEVITATKSFNLKEVLENVDIFWFRLAYKIDEKVLTLDTRCKYLVTPVTGIDHIDEELCERLGVKIICLRGETSFLQSVKATAELTIALTFALMRNLYPAIIHVKNKGWNRDLFRGNELDGKTVGIIGMGRLGNIVASYFAAFGCNILYYDPFVDIDQFKKISNLTTLVQQADIITLHVNYNKANHHLIGKPCFEVMNRNAILINTSRGGLIDENALLESLQNGQLKGAALDVLYNEPNVSQHSLVEYASVHDNLIITPHIGGNTYESFEKTENFICQKLISIIDRDAKL